MGEYLVRCVQDGSVLPPYALSCPNDGSLLRTDYRARRLELKDYPGFWRFYAWLPVQGIIPQASAGSVTYQSRGLARELELLGLYISFSGYWPERGAAMPTCSFKDLEAPPTIQRLREHGGEGRNSLPSSGSRSSNSGSNNYSCSSQTLVVASAGNTGRAFAEAASRTGQPLLLLVPEKALARLWTTVEPGPVTLIGVNGDYYDAITLAERASSLPGFVPEGGARNIARRDGMGTVMLDAALHLGRMPQHYFQAVGSGTGGISAWEAALRLKEDGRFGSDMPRLHLAQNIPNAPIYYAWKGLEAVPAAQEMFDDVLFNRKPPFGMTGGVRDALLATNGEVYGITDQEAASAKRLFEQTEEIDILNAPGVAVAALEKAAEAGTIDQHDIILLNITGGGLCRAREDLARHQLLPDITVSNWDETAEFLESRP